MRTTTALLFLAAVWAALVGVSLADPVMHVITSTTNSRSDLNSAIGRCKVGPKVRREFSRALVAATAEDLSEEQLTCLNQYIDLRIEKDQQFTAIGIASSWGLDRLDQESGLDSTYTVDALVPAREVHAFVLDTGINAQHVDFGGRVDTSFSFSLYNKSPLGEDGQGHGTHCSGTIGGTTYGVAPFITLHPVKVLSDRGSGSTSGIIEGIDWLMGVCSSTGALAGKPCIASMSLGGGISESLDAAVNNMVSAGITTVVAAGNDAGDACNYSPARAASAITVGSTDRPAPLLDYVSSFSNFGSCIDIFAPGRDITSAWIGSTTATRTISGTSMAAPHVAGVVAQIIAVSPASTPTQIRDKVLDLAGYGLLVPSSAMGGSMGASPNLLLRSYHASGWNKRFYGTCA